MRLAIVAVMLVGTSVSADTEIYRCALDDGTFAFQEKPCPAPVEKVEKPADPPAKRDEPLAKPEATLPQPVTQDRAECEKATRDAIDAIDLEMRQAAYSKEQGQEYLAALRVLTRQLRACKQL